MDEVIKFIRSKIKPTKIGGTFREFEVEEPKEDFIAIDGGSSKIVDGGAWAIGLVRIGKVKYNSKGKISEETKDYWVGISEDEIKVFDEKEIKTPVRIRDVEHPFETAINDVRKFLEWEEASKEEDIVLMDSILKPIETWQISILKKMKRVIGIPKTTRESINGRSIVGLIVNKPGKWIYKVNDLTFVKFHELSEYVYKVDMKGVDEEIIPKIAFFASDPEMIGYPYPLLKVDKIARITKEEKRSLEFKIKQKLGEISDDLKSQDMHKNLDLRAHRK